MSPASVVQAAAMLVPLIFAGGCVTTKREIQPEPIWKTEAGRQEVRLKLAETLLDQEQADEAQAILAQMRKEGTIPAEVDLLQGRVFYQQGLMAEAEDSFEKVKVKTPSDGRVWKWLGVVYADTQRPDLAIDAFQMSVKRQPADASAWNNLGFMLLSQRRADEAIKALEEAVTRDGTQDRYRNNLGFALFAAGRPNDALNAFKSAARGHEADAFYNLGQAYELGGDLAKAHQEYNRALQLNPGHTLAYEAAARVVPTVPSPAPNEVPHAPQ